MALTRRHTLKGLAAGLGASLCPALFSSDILAQTPASSNNPFYLTTRKNPDGTYHAVILSAAGRDVVTLPLPGRGHDAACHSPSGACATFARRPGEFALAFNSNHSHTASQLITPKPGRHFYGHGVFSEDGRLLYSTENDFATSTGIIGIRDVEDHYRLIGEFPSFGIGPHEICLLSDHRTLVVANGGIATHPDSGRAKLNLATMAPNISYIDSHNGELQEQYQLPKSLHQLSIRHMSVSPNDLVAFGCQYQGPALDQPALIGVHRRGQELTTLPAPKEINPG